MSLIIFVQNFNYLTTDAQFRANLISYNVPQFLRILSRELNFTIIYGFWYLYRMTLSAILLPSYATSALMHSVNNLLNRKIPQKKLIYWETRESSFIPFVGWDVDRKKLLTLVFTGKYRLSPHPFHTFYYIIERLMCPAIWTFKRTLGWTHAIFNSWFDVKRLLTLH